MKWEKEKWKVEVEVEGLKKKDAGPTGSIL